MSETAVETVPVVLQAGDRVKVSNDALDGAGNAAPTRIWGKVGKLDFYDTYSGWYVRPEDGTTGTYVGPKYLSKVDDPDALRAEVARLTAEVVKLMGQREANERALLAFQERTRDALVAKAESSYVSDADEFDDLLDTLDLEGRERDFELKVSFEGSYYRTVTATSLDNAIAEAEEFSNVREYIGENIGDNWLDSVEAEEN